MEKRNGKKLVENAMTHRPQKDVPWVPYTGIHSGVLTGYKAGEVLGDAGKLAESLLAVNRTYLPDGQPIYFDLQVEAEILGCQLLWADNSPPSVKSHPLGGSSALPNQEISKKDGRIPVILEAAKQLRDEAGEHTALYGLLCGPFTLASHLRGSEMFMDMSRNPEYVEKLVEYCSRIAESMVQIYAEAGCDVIAPVDPLISQISPKHFEQFCSKGYTSLFKMIRKSGTFSSFFVCGNAHNKTIENMCNTGPDAISVDEVIDMQKGKEITDRYNIAIGGNIPLTTVLLYGNENDTRRYIVDLLDLFEDRTNLVISPGCDMPYDIPPANVIAAAEAVIDPDSARKML